MAYNYNPYSSAGAGNIDWRRIMDLIQGYNNGGGNGMDFNSLLSLIGNRGNGYASAQYSPVRNMQSTWGMSEPQWKTDFNNAQTDTVASGMAQAFSGGDKMMNPEGFDSAKSKFSGFLNGTDIGGSAGVKSGGMSKSPSAYIEAAKDIASWSMDIADSSKSRMNLPDYSKYHGNTVHDIYDYNMLKRQPSIGSNWATQKPKFWGSFLDTNRKSIKGAMDGYNISNNWIGAVVGGVVGAGFGVGNALAKLGTHNRDVRRIRRWNDINDMNFMLAQNQAASNIDTQNNTSMYGQRVMGNIGAMGGLMDSPGMFGATEYKAGGTHEENPNGGIQVGIGSNGKPNLVEEGEVRWNDFIFSKRVKPTREILTKHNSDFRKDFDSYADAASHILELHKERENSPFDRRALDIQMERLAQAQEYEKLADEAAENGMSPEEYSEYLQYVQQYGNGQMAEGGNMFRKGGDLGGGDTEKPGFKRRTEDGMPRHNGPVERYYENNGQSAWYIDKFLDYLAQEELGEGFMHKPKSTDRYEYSATDGDKYMNNVRRLLKEDPDAVYYMYYRIKQLQGAFGENGGAITNILGGDIYNFGNIFNRLGIDNKDIKNNGGKYFDQNKQENKNVAITDYGITDFGVGIAPVSAEKKTDAVWNSISADAAKYNANLYVPSNANTVNTLQNPAKTSSVNSVSYFGMPGTSYPRTSYHEPEWNEFKKNRDNPDVVNAFTDDFNKNHGTNYTPDYIRRNLNDGLVGPIHNEFAAYIRPSAKPEPVAKSAAPATTAQDNGGQDETTPSANGTDTTTETATGVQTTNNNRLGLTPYDSMRLAPVYESLRSVLQQDPPDYTYANQLASLYRPMSYRSTGQYMRYMPVDQHYLDTMANTQKNNLYGFYRNNAVSNAAADYYATMAGTIGRSQAAQAYRDSVLQNNQNRNNVLQYNNQLDAANENARMQTQQFNAQNYANIMAQSYGAAEQERLAVEQAREANRQNLAANIGLVGRELSDRYYVSRNPALLYGPMGSYYKYLQEQTV